MKNWHIQRYAELQINRYDFPTMKSQGAAKNEANNAAQSTPVAAKVVVPVEETAAPAKVEIDFSNVEVRFL